MAKHSLRIDFDDSTGDLTITHRCLTSLGGHDVGISEAVILDEPEATKAVLRSLLDANREEMERHGVESAITHVAAVNGTLRKKGQKTLTVGGSLGAAGGAVAKKE